MPKLSFNDMLSIIEIIDKGKNREAFDKYRQATYFMNLMKDKTALKRFLLFNAVQKAFPDQRFQQSLSKTMSPQERRLKGLISPSQDTSSML